MTITATYTKNPTDHAPATSGWEDLPPSTSLPNTECGAAGGSGPGHDCPGQKAEPKPPSACGTFQFLCDTVVDLVNQGKILADTARDMVVGMAECVLDGVSAQICISHVIEDVGGAGARNAINLPITTAVILSAVNAGGSCSKEAYGMTVCQVPGPLQVVVQGHVISIPLYQRGGTTLGSVYVTESFDSATEDNRLRHEARHAYQWSANPVAFAVLYPSEEFSAQISSAAWNLSHSEDRITIDSACFNRFEIDANTTDGGYGLSNGAPCP